MTNPLCRYALAGCRKPAEYFCDECSPGHYCAEHAARHNRLVIETLIEQGIDPKHAVLAERIPAAAAEDDIEQARRLR